jgi:hypothetical protein
MEYVAGSAQFAQEDWLSRSNLLYVSLIPDLNKTLPDTETALDWLVEVAKKPRRWSGKCGRARLF